MLEQVLDALYPPTCISCGKGGEWLCENCVSRITVFNELQDPLPPFTSVTACGKYANPFLRRVLTTFKYRSATCLKEVLSTILRNFRTGFLSAWPWAEESEMIITSIPTDRRHVRERGFDHAALCADLVREILLPWGTRDDLLRRTKHVLAQAALPADALREVNMKHSFAATKAVTTPILLVDDILTTGSTAKEAARALQEKGAKDIHLFVFASGK
jgi:ComF family protein